MALFVHETRSPPKTDEDRISLHKYMVAYSARYAVEGDIQALAWLTKP